MFGFNKNDEEELDERLIYSMFGQATGDLLIGEGYETLELIENAPDEELLAINGIGQATLNVIRDRIPAREFLNENAGVSEESATTPSEVKPDSMEAETAEAEHAEPAEAVEAPDAVGTLSENLDGGDLVPIRSLWPSRIVVTAPSGTRYEWERGGSQVNVEAADVEFVMSKNRNAGRACCGSSGERIYFEIT